MIKNSNAKNVLAILFVVIMFIQFVKGGAYLEISKLADYLKNYNEYTSEVDVDTLESEFASGLWKSTELIELNSYLAKMLNMQGFYSDIGIYVTNDKYIVSAYPYTTTDYEVEQMVSLKQFLDENDINLLYVNEPIKYVDDSLLEEQFGVETYSNRNMDVFLDRLKKAGIQTLDLRNNIEAENLNVKEMFYRTDHHWTVAAGFWATGKIVEAMNEYCGYHIDMNIYDISNYEVITWENCWLGEQGRKVGKTYVGLDDFTKIVPKFSTDLTFSPIDGPEFDGTFDDFIDESAFQFVPGSYQTRSLHYSYNLIDCVNNNVDYGKVLILGDSYEHVMQPFLSLGVHEVDCVALRGLDDSFSLKDYILENDYDTVLVCYAQFLLGESDDPTSVNSHMYDFWQ